MKSPTARLVAGLVFTLSMIGGYAAFTLHSVKQVRAYQTSVVERNRRASLQLIRIQNGLNALALTMREMLDGEDRVPLSAWDPALGRLRKDLESAFSAEAAASAGLRKDGQAEFLRSAFQAFGRDCDRVLREIGRGDWAAARRLARGLFEPRQEELMALTARLLVEANDQESRAGEQVERIYSELERNVYRLLGLSLILTLLTGVGLIRSNRRLFSRLAALADERKELTRSLIASQEAAFRAISRDLHDEFGQILTALGAMLRRADRHAATSEFRRQIQEASEIVQAALDKTRALSQALQPVILDEQGLLPAIEWHLAEFERQTGIAVRYRKPGAPDLEVAPGAAIHTFRILQEALNNVARHAGVDRVRVAVEQEGDVVAMAIEDEGRGIPDQPRAGLGLAGMRERAGLIGGHLYIGPREDGPGTLVWLAQPALARQSGIEAGAAAHV